MRATLLCVYCDAALYVQLYNGFWLNREQVWKCIEISTQSVCVIGLWFISTVVKISPKHCVVYWKRLTRLSL